MSHTPRPDPDVRAAVLLARCALLTCWLTVTGLAQSTTATLQPADIVADAPKGRTDFVNFEVPQVKPIAVATITDGTARRDLLLVCNTPDNSVEIYDANPPHRFLKRIPVGLGPVTVRYDEFSGRFYTCNFVGDSVSMVRLGHDPNSVDGFEALLERTVWVGDEPSDITIMGGMFAIVTLNSQSAISVVSARDLSPIVARFDLIYPDLATGLQFAVKQPRAITSLPDGRIYALNFMGDHKAQPGQLYDFDLFSYDASVTDALPFGMTGGMGTTNHAFAVTRDGSRMFVVGTRAQNLEAVGVEAVRELKTGFVQSHMWVVDIIPGLPPVVRAEAPGGDVLSPGGPFSINLNRDYTKVGLEEVPPEKALSQPTDVFLLENNQFPSMVEKVFITAYHSDKVAVLHPEPSAPSGWKIRQIHVPAPNDIRGYGASGPRGLAFSPNASDPDGTGPPGLLFAANRLNNSVAVIDPYSETLVDQFYLRNDPTPMAIRKGRKFLYSAAQFSGNRMVTCASCHVDGRTDGLAWNLGDLQIGPEIKPWFHDGNGQTVETMPNFPNDKGPMATQTLQGLVNSRVNEGMQVMFTNAPYHWRGDKPRFNDFNEAFVNLQGMENINTPEDPKGITDEEMVDFTRFINTIVHPPNPEQNLDRTVKGSLGDDPNDPTLGSGAALGLKLYHVQPIVGPRSCVQCHTLPDGSSNTGTEVELLAGTLGNMSQLQPFETAATRNLFQREMLHHRDSKIPTAPFILSGNFGLLHAGDPGIPFTLSINDFVGNVFVAGMPGPSDAEKVAQVEALIRFMRQFDTGISPLVGFAHTFVPGDTFNMPIRSFLEAQAAQANIGIAAYVRRNGIERGYYYDLSVSPPGYREEGTTNLIPGSALDLMFASASGEVVIVLQATPVGSERRVASMDGIPTVIRDETRPPEDVVLEAMAPGTQWMDVTKFTANLDPPPPMISQLSLRTLQDSVIGLGFGVPSLRHEPPRRFRVSGKNIRPGARLAIGMAETEPGTTDPAKIHLLWMPLVPTGTTRNGRPVWESSAEADAAMTMALLNGGLWAPGVADVLIGEIPPSEPLDPLGRNFFLVGVLNEDDTLNSNIEWQRITVQDGR